MTNFIDLQNCTGTIDKRKLIAIIFEIKLLRQNNFKNWKLRDSQLVFFFLWMIFINLGIYFIILHFDNM